MTAYNLHETCAEFVVRCILCVILFFGSIGLLGYTAGSLYTFLESSACQSAGKELGFPWHYSVRYNECFVLIGSQLYYAEPILQGKRILDTQSKIVNTD